MDKIKSHRDLNVYQLSSKAGNKLITETIAGMCGNARQRLRDWYRRSMKEKKSFVDIMDFPYL